MKQYNDLYKHVDKLANEPIPNYLCYSCNYAEYGRISCLSKHVQSEEHCQSVARLANDSNEYLFCSGCGKFFNSDSIMVHAEHFLEDRSNEMEEDVDEDEDDEVVDKPVTKKRRLMEDIVDKYEENLGFEKSFISILANRTKKQVDEHYPLHLKYETWCPQRVAGQGVSGQFHEGQVAQGKGQVAQENGQVGQEASDGRVGLEA